MTKLNEQSGACGTFLLLITFPHDHWTWRSVNHYLLYLSVILLPFIIYFQPIIIVVFSHSISQHIYMYVLCYTIPYVFYSNRLLLFWLFTLILSLITATKMFWTFYKNDKVFLPPPITVKWIIIQQTSCISNWWLLVIFLLHATSLTIPPSPCH